MRHTFYFGIMFASLTFLAHLPEAHANGEAGPNPIYVVSVQGNSVQVCPQGPIEQACPDASGMLRQDTASQQVVRLDDFCGTDYLTHCYVDECVPKGTYVYGFATSFECCTDCARTDYFGVAEVQTDLPAECMRSEGNAGPTPTDQVVPWPAYDPDGQWPNVCDQAPGDAAGETTNSSEGGCVAHSGARASVLGVHLFAAALGALLLGWRRKAR